jgi:hypothetical protein
MAKNRKDDQHYEDLYDRMTISTLKGIEKEKSDLNKYPHTVIEGSSLGYSITHRIKFNDEGALRAQKRDITIADWKKNDEEKDRTIERYSPPPVLDCKQCNVRMHFQDYIFLDNNYEVIFAYDCPKEKEHRKLYYNNGVEYVVQRPSCTACGGKIKTETKRTKLTLTFTDTCVDCGKTTKDKLTRSPDTPVTEEDRKKYCTAFKNSSTLLQDMKKMADLYDYLQNTKAKDILNKELEVDKIEKLKISVAEERLKKVTADKGFVKFQLENQKLGRYLVVDFSVQDNSDRESNESVKTLKKLLKSELLMTNWRLMDSEITCRFGILTGKLKAFEDEENIQKIAKEVKDSRYNSRDGSK